MTIHCNFSNIFLLRGKPIIVQRNMDLRFFSESFKILREQNLFNYRTTIVFEDYNV